MNTKAALNDQTDPGSSPSALSLFESITLLNECRDLAAEWLTSSLETMLKQLEDALFDQADKAYDRNQANLYLESRALVQSRRAEIEGQFRRRFVETFNGKINTKPQETSMFGKIVPGNLELSLVANDTFEEQLAVEDIAKRFKEASGPELNALDQRIGFLLQRTADEKNNPLSPESITEAFKAACEDLDFSSEVKRIMLDQFNSRFVTNVPQFYKTINQHLVARNVMPVIRTVPRINRTSASRMANYPSSKPSEPMGVAEVAQAMEQGDWQHILSHLMGMPGFSGGGMPGSGVGAQMASMSSAAPAVALIGELNRLQQSQVGQMSTGDVLPFSAGANILHELKSGALSQLTPEKESITIDIVAMLFDYIFDDKSIPSSIKALIGRLQIPVLKVAILDNKFFSKKAHPARKLLDSLASASIGLSDEDAACQRLESKASQIIQKVLTQFEDDIQIFVEAQAQLEAFLAEEGQRAAEEASKAAKSIYENERLELARVMAADELRQRAVDTYVPGEIKDFFEKYWSMVAAHAFLSGGENGQAWTEAMLTAENLVWSVAPKTSVEDRMKLVTLLPDLLRRLEKGLATVQTPQEVKEAFFASLVQCHAQAIKSGVKGGSDTTATPRAVATTGSARPGLMPEAARLPSSVQAQSGQPDPAAVKEVAAVRNKPATQSVSPAKAQLQALDTQEFDPLAGSLAAALTVSAEESQPPSTSVPEASLTRLKRGELVEINNGKGERMVMKLAWISPLQGVYLFTNRDGQNARSIDKAELESMLKQGQMQILERTGLFDRAMTTMVSQLQSTAA